MKNALRLLLIVLSVLPLHAQEIITIDVEQEFSGQLGYQLSFARGAWYATFKGQGSDPPGIVEFDIENGDFTPINPVPFQNLSINEAYGLAVTREGKFIVVGGDSLVHLIDITGRQIREWAANCTPADHEEYSIAACDTSNRIYIATNNSPMVIVYSEFGQPLDTLLTTGAISRTVYVREEDEAILVLSEDSSGCALDVYNPALVKVRTYDYNHPLPGLPGAGDPSGSNNYRDWKRIAASDTKVLISQWSGYQTSAHRILVFDKTLSYLHCQMRQTADTRVDRSLNFPSGMDLNGDVCRFLDKMSDGNKYLSEVYGTGFCNADPPEAAAKLTATYFPDHVTLQWDPSPSSAVRYRVYRAREHGQYDFIAPPVCMTTGTECTDMSGVSPGTAYCYVVRAERDGYESASSNEVCGSTPYRIVNLTVIPARVAFGYVPAGTSDTITVGLRNDASSNSSLAYSAHGLAHPFSLTDTTSHVLAPGQSRNIDIVFSPAGNGEARQDWIIDHNATNQTNPLSIHVSGGDTLEHPDIVMTVIPSNIDFGYVPVGQSDTITVAIKNDILSTDTLEFEAAAMLPPFSIADTTAQRLAPGDSTIMHLAYSPVVAERITRDLRFDHNATNLTAPFRVTVAGGEIGTDSLIIVVRDLRGAIVRNAIVRRFSLAGRMISQRTSVGEGWVVRWDSIPAGDYLIEVYNDAQRPPYMGEEFWGSMQVSVVDGGTNTYEFTRLEPCTAWTAFEQQGRELHLNNPLAENEEVTAIVTVTNNASVTRTVRGVMAIDRDMQSSYDHELSFGPVEIPSRGEHRFSVTFTPQYDDFYHDGVMIEAYRDSTFGLTDSWAWSPPQCTYHPDAEDKGVHTVQPASFCDENAVWYDRFDDLGNWTKGSSPPRGNFEDCTFQPSNVALDDSVLTLTAQSLYEGVGYPGHYYFGGQVTSFQTFGPDQDYSMSCSMKPSAEDGVINSFGVVSILEEDLRDEDRCSENYHHIDIQIAFDASGLLKCAFTTGTRVYQCQRDEVFNEHCPEYTAPDHDRIESSSYILLPVSYSESFHKYGFRWSGNSVIFMIDDSVVSVHQRDDAVLKIVPTRSAYMRIGAWISDRSWTGPGGSVPWGTVGVCEVNAVCVSDNATGVSPAAEMDYRLSPPYPNPSRGNIDIEFELDAAEYVTLRIYDIHGVEVETLIDQTMPPGTHHSRWNTRDVNSGVYYYVLSTRDGREMRKIVVL